MRHTLCRDLSLDGRKKCMDLSEISGFIIRRHKGFGDNAFFPAKIHTYHYNGHTGFFGDVIETGTQPRYFFAGAFRRKGQYKTILAVKLRNHLVYHIVLTEAVYRHPTQLAEEKTEPAFEEGILAKVFEVFEMQFAAESQSDHKIPGTGMRTHDHHAFGQVIRKSTVQGPSCYTEIEAP